MSDELLRVLILVPVFLVSLCLHEFAHAFVAMRLGDNTARSAGRLTLNPLAHADMVGTLLLPGICIYYGMPFFGWAKPVPVDIRSFQNPRRDMAFVAAAGPVSNLLLAGLSALSLSVALRSGWTIGDFNLSSLLEVLSIVGIQVNLFLAFFNLIPLPPLDGFNILQAVLPLRWAAQVYRLTPLSSLLLLALFFTGGLRLLAAPVQHIYSALVSLVG